jgi:phosphatidylglycerophosphatase A
MGSPAPSADRGEARSSSAPTARAAAGRRLALLVATAGGAGYSPVAPGTAGAAVGTALYWLIAPAGSSAVTGTAVALLVLGVLAADVAERSYEQRDDGRIVIDEVVGQLLALAPLPLLGAARNPLLIGAGFLAFRLFDIWKPGPVRWAERNFAGGVGVMLDDVLAGLLAGACVASLAALVGAVA